MDPKEIMGTMLGEYAADQGEFWVVRKQGTGEIVFKTDLPYRAEAWVELQLDPDFYNIEVRHE